MSGASLITDHTLRFRWLITHRLKRMAITDPLKYVHSHHIWELDKPERLFLTAKTGPNKQ
jgi:hypothetical protein